jgi:hypothetical protein
MEPAMLGGTTQSAPPTLTGWPCCGVTAPKESKRAQFSRGQLHTRRPLAGSTWPKLHELRGGAPPALQRNVALGYPEAAEHLVEQAGGTGVLTVQRIHDVVRFDGIAHYWAAMVTERPIARGVDPADTVLRQRVERALQPHTAADGTMRIACEAVVISSAAS